MKKIGHGVFGWSGNERRSNRYASMMRDEYQTVLAFLAWLRTERTEDGGMCVAGYVPDFFLGTKVLRPLAEEDWHEVAAAFAERDVEGHTC